MFGTRRKWHMVEIPASRILKHNMDVTTIACPTRSKYRSYRYEHPTDLVQIGEGETSVRYLRFTDAFKFKLFKPRRNEVVDRITLTAKEFEEIYK